MYSITQQGDTVDYGVIECVCSTEDDISTLPTTWNAGSTCLVIANSSVWMLGADGEWHKL